MKYSLHILFIIIQFSLVSCRHDKKSAALLVEEIINLDSIPSGSGIAIRGDTAYIIGDDAPAIYLLNINNNGYSRLAINGLPSAQYRISKAQKQDLETACFANWQGKEYLLAFGSGSSSPIRDTLLMINITNPGQQQAVSLGVFYKQLQQLNNTDPKQWNIEAAAIIGKKLFLFNRGTNQLINVNLDSLLNYLLQRSTVFPETSTRLILGLPSISNHTARFSGACTLDSSHLLFSASVEDSPDWVTDGPILGSFIGLYDIKNDSVLYCRLLKKDSSVLKEKLESLDILRRDSNGDLLILAISDNDNGSSRLFRLRLADQ